MIQSFRLKMTKFSVCFFLSFFFFSLSLLVISRLGNSWSRDPSYNLIKTVFFFFLPCFVSSDKLSKREKSDIVTFYKCKFYMDNGKERECVISLLESRAVFSLLINRGYIRERSEIVS